MLSDPGGVREITARWAIAGELLLESAAHLGAGRGDSVDMSLLRDPLTGGPVLTGASLAGALRSYLADVLGGYRSNEDARVAQLFGVARGDDVGEQSPLIVFDSIGHFPAASSVEIRDGLQIDAPRGTAAPHKKFDVEVLPAGTLFAVRFDLLISDVDQEDDLLNLLVTALNGLSNGDISLGARRSRGLGAIRAGRWQARRYDLTTAEGWLEWVSSDWEMPLSAERGTSDEVREACMRAHRGVTLTSFDDRRRRIRITANISPVNGVLVRSAPAAADAPDTAHIKSDGRSVLPGTALAGAIRNHAGRIARVAGEGHADSDRWVERMFGPRSERVSGTPPPRLYASRVRIQESFLDDGARMRPSRVRIDRFTQGIVPGALFDEEPEFGGRARVLLELREPEPGELGLLLLLVRDLLDGDLAVGGASSVGRGRFTGRGTLTLEDGRSVDLDPRAPADPTVTEAIEELWASPVIDCHP